MADDLGPLDRLNITTPSPDGLISAIQTGESHIELRFRPGAYQRYSAEVLESQLAQLATRAWIAYRRAYFQAFSAARGYAITGNEPVFSPREQRFKQEQAALEVGGVSLHGWITVRSLALVRWQVRIRQGFNRQLTEEEFLTEADTALSALLRDYFDKVLQLRVKHFNLQLPDPPDNNQRSRPEGRPRPEWR